MLARRRTQIEQPRFDAIEQLRIVSQRVHRRHDQPFGLARLDHRAIERGQRFGQ